MWWQRVFVQAFPDTADASSCAGGRERYHARGLRSAPARCLCSSCDSGARGFLLRCTRKVRAQLSKSIGATVRKSFPAQSHHVSASFIRDLTMCPEAGADGQVNARLIGLPLRARARYACKVHRSACSDVFAARRERLYRFVPAVGISSAASCWFFGSSLERGCVAACYVKLDLHCALRGLLWPVLRESWWPRVLFFWLVFLPPSAPSALQQTRSFQLARMRCYRCVLQLLLARFRDALPSQQRKHFSRGCGWQGEAA